MACPLVLTGTTGAPTAPTLSTGGSGCPGNPPIGQTLNLGTPADPKLIYFRGELDTSSNFTGLRLNGTVKGAGMLSDGRTASTGTDGAGESQAQQPTKGKVAGPLEWPGVNSRERLIKVRVTLTGEDDATKSVNLSRPFRLGERYEFRDLAPGKYRLVGKAEDGAPALELWNQNVTVEAGQVTQLPLAATNSKVTPDQFPGPAPK